MASEPTIVIRNDDDRLCPVTGAVLGWEDEDRCHVAWGDAQYSDDPWREARIEWADELMPIRRKVR